MQRLRLNPPEADIVNAVRFTTNFFLEVTSKYGALSEKLAKEFADKVKGKRIRSVNSAVAAIDKKKLKFNTKDRTAIANAIRSQNFANLSKNLKSFSVGLKQYGHVADATALTLELAKSIETNNYRGFFVKLEAFLAGKVAAAAVAFAFSIIAGVPLGIIGYGLIMAITAAMINDALMESLNRYLRI